MKIIINERQLRRLVREYQDEIEEIDTTGTYLDREKIGTSYDKNKLTLVSRFGNVFKDAPTTSDKSYGLEFIEDRKNMYVVNFPSDFGSKYYSEDINFDDLFTIPLILMHNGFPTNRIHFLGGIPNQLKGTGLGYVIYKEFIKFLGWASSTSDSSESAMVIWSKLVNDPDFYSFLINGDEESKIFVIYKKTDKDIVDIVKSNIELSDIKIKSIKFEDELINAYPELKKYQEMYL